MHTFLCKNRPHDRSINNTRVGVSFERGEWSMNITTTIMLFILVLQHCTVHIIRVLYCIHHYFLFTRKGHKKSHDGQKGRLPQRKSKLLIIPRKKKGKNYNIENSNNDNAHPSFATTIQSHSNHFHCLLPHLRHTAESDIILL